MSSQKPVDLTKLLSEAFKIDKMANNPRARDFLEAGERLLRTKFARDATCPAEDQQPPPFEEVFAWLSRRRIVTEAIRGWASRADSGKDSGPTEAAFRYRWRTQTAYLRDVAIWALQPRARRPDLMERTYEVIERVRDEACQLHEAIREIAHDEITALRADPAVRMQMVFQATLARDPGVSDALRQIDDSNVEAWTEFVRQSYETLGLTLREDLTFSQLGRALRAAGQGALFHAILAPDGSGDPSGPTELLSLLAEALVIATADHGDGRSLDDILRDLVRPRAQDPPAEP